MVSCLAGGNWFTEHRWTSQLCHLDEQTNGTRTGGEDIDVLLFLWGSFLCSICGLWSVVSLHAGLFMVDYFVESHGGVKGDEQY
ncbi:hypothetical protein, partial [uncultured Gimesia sp.]|uniref:hypothetical protein n=1 Tax=uncultured Gimesia sp. TaxID=1678688 RepID=UPI0030D709BF